MMVDGYSPPGFYLWDPWFIKVGEVWHVFHLQAPAGVDPELRHTHCGIGHARSKDLVNWEQMPLPIITEHPEMWDGGALWTGSVVEKDGVYYLFYTGISSRMTWRQRIGFATSTDLTTWKKYEHNPSFTVYDRFYEAGRGKNKLGNPPAWRDPHVFWDKSNQKYFMVFTARDAQRENPYNGCIGLASSDDLITWEEQMPILTPGRFDEMETPQIVIHDGRYYLFFSTWAKNYETGYASDVGAKNALHCYVSDFLFGGFEPLIGDGVLLDYHQELYDVRLVERMGDAYTAIGWLNKDEDGNFVGKLSPPFTIQISGDDLGKVIT